MSIIERLRMPALGAAFLALVAWASCRNPAIELTPKEQVFYDSLVTALESQYTNERPHLGFYRSECLLARTDSVFDRDAINRMYRHAENLVRSRQSIAVQDRRDSRLTGEHPIATDEYCREVDSLWYASLRQPSRGR